MKSIEESAHSAAWQIFEEIGLSKHSVDRVSEIIKGLSKRYDRIIDMGCGMNKLKTIVGNEIAQEPNFYVKALKALREKNEMKFKDTALEKEFNKLMTQYENQTQSSNE